MSNGKQGMGAKIGGLVLGSKAPGFRTFASI